MAQRFLKRTPRKVVPTATGNGELGTGNGGVGSPLPATVIVGTYKDRQIGWIKRHGIYNYPVKDGDEFDKKALASVREFIPPAVRVKTLRLKLGLSQQEFGEKLGTYQAVVSLMERGKADARIAAAMDIIKRLESAAADA